MGKKPLFAWIIAIAFLGAGLFPGQLWAQEGDTTFQGDKHSMEYLLFLFQHDKDANIPHGYLAETYKNRIPNYLVKTYLPHKPVANPEKGYYAGKLPIANEHYTALVYEKPCFKGEYCRTQYLTTLGPDGELIGHTILAFDSISRLSMDTMKGTILQQRLVEKVGSHVAYQFKETGAKITKSAKDFYHYMHLNDKGELKPLADAENSPNRQFPWSSKRLVQSAELDELTTRELNIFKNEIFADYQFRFPSERWREYFNKKDWYEPRYKNVNDSLNIIERFNIKRVIRFQRNDS